MHIKIARHAFAVVRETSPAKEPHHVEWALWSISQESLPIDILLARVRRNGIDPSARGRVAVGMTFNVGNLAQPSRRINLLRLPVNDFAHSLAARLKYPLVCLHCFYHRKAIGYVVRHRLL